MNKNSRQKLAHSEKIQEYQSGQAAVGVATLFDTTDSNSGKENALTKCFVAKQVTLHSFSFYLQFVNNQTSELPEKHGRQRRRTQFVHCQQEFRNQSDNCCRDLTASVVAQTRRSKRPLHCRTSSCLPCARPKTTESRPASHRLTLRAEQHQPSCGVEQSRRTINIPGCPAMSPG